MKTLVLSRAKALPSFYSGEDTEKHLPAYPLLGARVAALRKRKPSPEADRELGLAILEAVNKMNRTAGMKAANPISCPCVSGTWHTDGNAILKAINSQNAARALAGLEEDHARRSDAQIRAALEATLAGQDVPMVYQIHLRKGD